MDSREFKAGGREEKSNPSDDSSDNSEDIDAEISALEEGSSDEENDAQEDDEETDEDDGTGVDNPNFSPMPRKKVNRTDAGHLQ